jgi:mannose-1-phosphate guanylyltransferase
MKSLLLAAGFGTRLRPITNTVPKCLVPVQGKPLLAYWLDLLKPDADNPTLINTHYLPEIVSDFIKTSRWKMHCSLVHEAELLGTGGTILHNQAFFRNAAFLVIHADNLTRFDLNAFIEAHHRRPSGVEITMMTFDTDMPQSCGIVETDQDNIVIGFHEKSPNPPGIRANAAVYIMEPSIIEFLQSLNKKIIDLSTEVLPNYLHHMQVFHNASYHRDIGTPESLQLAETEF